MGDDLFGYYIWLKWNGHQESFQLLHSRLVSTSLSHMFENLQYDI